MNPIFTAFYTRDTIYEQEAARLIRSLDRLGLEHDVRAIDSLGDWQANSGHTATHIATMQAAYPGRPIVQLDADAVVWQLPTLFDSLPSSGCDIAVHYRKGQEMLNGTMWLAPTDGARLIIQRYREYVIRAGPNCHNEQRMLQNAIAESSDLVKVQVLPAGYCFIADLMKEDLAPGEEVVIEHLQASREAPGHYSAYTESRRKRLAEIGAMNL